MCHQGPCRVVIHYRKQIKSLESESEMRENHLLLAFSSLYFLTLSNLRISILKFILKLNTAQLRKHGPQGRAIELDKGEKERRKEHIYLWICIELPCFYVADLSFKVVNNEMLRKLACISPTAVKIETLQVLHSCPHLQWLLTLSHFSTMVFKVNINKIKIPLIVRLFIIFVF